MTSTQVSHFGRDPTTVYTQSTHTNILSSTGPSGAGDSLAHRHSGGDLKCRNSSKVFSGRDVPGSPGRCHPTHQDCIQSK
ncbi:hypothetical protein B0J17DRAFT_253635 [Rhizoctonia solani]|nr:hypothetical protein B0J17DRAFT_354402 [Rhizoctonia solani]KAH7341230.1 hypothetical protein B0J17DRAFT_253635 [Rhizoctonia solani]